MAVSVRVETCREQYCTKRLMWHMALPNTQVLCTNRTCRHTHTLARSPAQLRYTHALCLALSLSLSYSTISERGKDEEGAIFWYELCFIYSCYKNTRGSAGVELIPKVLDKSWCRKSVDDVRNKGGCGLKCIIDII